MYIGILKQCHLNLPFTKSNVDPRILSQIRMGINALDLGARSGIMQTLIEKYNMSSYILLFRVSIFSLFSSITHVRQTFQLPILSCESPFQQRLSPSPLRDYAPCPRLSQGQHEPTPVRPLTLSKLQRQPESLNRVELS